MKVALIKKQDSSFWRSCQSITENLLKSYERFCHEHGHEHQVFNYQSGANALESFDLAKQVLSEGFEQVVWLDHYPHPHGFIKAFFEQWKKQSKKAELPQFTFHLFGDFILQAPLWLQVQKEVDELALPVPFRLICASHKQKQLVESLLNEESSYDIGVVPFPVDETVFNFREEARERVRQELGVQEDEMFLLYTGRLSHQKNILDLIYGLAQYQKTFNKKTKLFLSGPMDDLGIPYLGKEALDGTFFFHWEEALRDHQPLVDEKRIHYLGNLNHSELSDLYSAADLFVSLSCHNDEDYGMSPAEALMSGLPCVLSDWGGYASFHNYAPDSVRLVPIMYGDTRHEPRQGVFVKGLVALEQEQGKEHAENISKRQGIMKEAGKHLSVTAVVDKLAQLYKEKGKVTFPGFNGRFLKLCALYENNPNAPFRSPSGGFSLFYRELYQCYWAAFNKKEKA